MFTNGTHLGAQDLGALCELIEEQLGLAKAAAAAAAAAKPKVITYRSDITTMACKVLVQRIIRERGERAAAVLATKINAELARRGKARVKLLRPTTNGNGGNGAHLGA